MSRTVSLVVLFHVQERVVVKVAVEVDVRSSRRRWSVKLERDRDQDAERTRHASTTCTLAGADGGRKTGYSAISIYAHIATRIYETHARVEPTHIPVSVGESSGYMRREKQSDSNSFLSSKRTLKRRCDQKNTHETLPVEQKDK